MKKTYSILIILIYMIPFNPTKVIAQQDTPKFSLEDSSPIKERQFKLSKKEFLDTYGTDDTSKALINFFFTKRTSACINCFEPTALFIITAVLLREATTGLVPGGPTAIIGATFVFAILYAIKAVNQWDYYTRIRLLNFIISHKEGKPLPSTILVKLKNSGFLQTH